MKNKFRAGDLVVGTAESPYTITTCGVFLLVEKPIGDSLFNARISPPTLSNKCYYDLECTFFKKVNHTKLL